MSTAAISDERFWELVEAARASGSESANADRLADILSQLSVDEVRGFGVRFREKLAELNRWELWGAGYVIGGGMSDDGFRYFRCWLVGRGRQVFETALKGPDELGPFIENSDVENEALENVAAEVIESRGASEEPDGGAEIEPVGEPFDEETVSERYPKLAAQFG